MTEPDISSEARRSTRIALRIRIRISSRNSKDAVDAWTILINKQGAKLECAQEFTLGQAVGLAAFDGQIGRGKVVWTNPGPNANGNFEFAVELSEPSNLFGVSFPPEDWEPAFVPEF